MNVIKKNLDRLKYATSGILFALRTDYSYRTQAWSVLLVITIAVFFLQPLTQVEILFLSLAYTLILITELQNSSFEAALDHMHPDQHDNIGRSKDMAAGAVFSAGLFLVFVLIVITLT